MNLICIPNINMYSTTEGMLREGGGRKLENKLQTYFMHGPSPKKKRLDWVPLSTEGGPNLVFFTALQFFKQR